MHLSLIKYSALHVQDRQYISLAPLDARTCSTHSTRNSRVACGTGTLCAQSFPLVCRRDELLLYKRRTHKPCFKLKNEKLIYICILLQRNKPDVHRENKKFTDNFRISMNSWYLLVDQSKESNTGIFPNFDYRWNAIQ